MKLHPTPQFARSSWMDLNGEWLFSFDDEDVGIKEKWMKGETEFEDRIIVPYPPESLDSKINDTSFHSFFWYKRSFQDIRTVKENKRLILHFGAVDYEALIWVNGQYVGKHQGGQTSFNFDITDYLIQENEQSLIVRVKDFPQDLTQPRGKQGWEEKPKTIWYQRTSGIWQSVWLEEVNSIYINTLRWKSNITNDQIHLTITLNKDIQKPLDIFITLKIRNNVVAEEKIKIFTQKAESIIIISNNDYNIYPDKYLWSPETPNLFDAEIKLFDGNQILDNINSYVGLRSIDNENGRIQLNGHPYYLRMVLDQGYWPESHLAAPSNDSIYEEVKQIKSLGFNGVRIHQKVEDPHFLYWCDKLGILVWEEMANAYIFNEESVIRFTKEWIDVIERDFNHPSIIAWVPINESWGVPSVTHDPRQKAFLRAIYWLTKSFDSERLVIDNDGWEHVITDLISIHDYTQNEELLNHRYGTRESINELISFYHPNGHKMVIDDTDNLKTYPIVLSEFGGISWNDESSEEIFTYGSASSEEEFITKLQKLIHSVISSPILSGFCYTQLTDTEQEKNGLLTEDRVPKLNPEKYRQIFQMKME